MKLIFIDHAIKPREFLLYSTNLTHTKLGLQNRKGKLISRVQTKIRGCVPTNKRNSVDELAVQEDVAHRI